MKAHIVTIVIVDHDELGADGVKENVEAARYANRCIMPSVAGMETFDVGEWTDEHPLNYPKTDQLAWLKEHGKKEP